MGFSAARRGESDDHEDDTVLYSQNLGALFRRDVLAVDCAEIRDLIT